MFRLAFGVLLLVFVSPGQPCAAQTYVYAPDAAILLEARAGWGGDRVLPSWDASQPCNQWKGVTCDDSGRATLLDLSYNSLLSGSLPSSLGNLAALQEFQLSSTHLSGSIPSSLGRLSALQFLHLAYNQLSGSIPSTLGQLIGLVELHLRGNRLSGSLPSSIGNLTALATLDLASNRLSGPIPSSFVNLTELDSLLLSQNQLSGSIPSGFGLGVGARPLRLELQSNKLTGPLPPMAADTLEASDFSDNFLSGSCPSRPLEERFYGNCFQNCSAADTTKLHNPKKCSKACGSNRPTGPCLGKGTCFISGTKKASTCVCQPGFVSPASNPGTCVPAPSPPPSPPSPLPPPVDVAKLCAGAVANPKKCKCPRGGRCMIKSYCDNKYVCRCLGVGTKSVTDPKTGIVKACLRKRKPKL